MVAVLLKFVIAFAVVGLLRTSGKFRTMSRETDEAVAVSLKRIMNATEESGLPRETVLLLIALTTVTVVALLAG
jgi:hypothetical protein